MIDCFMTVCWLKFMYIYDSKNVFPSQIMCLFYTHIILLIVTILFMLHWNEYDYVNPLLTTFNIHFYMTIYNLCDINSIKTFDNTIKHLITNLTWFLYAFEIICNGMRNYCATRWVDESVQPSLRWNSITKLLP